MATSKNNFYSFLLFTFSASLNVFFYFLLFTWVVHRSKHFLPSRTLELVDFVEQLQKYQEKDNAKQCEKRSKIRSMVDYP